MQHDTSAFLSEKPASRPEGIFKLVQTNVDLNAPLRLIYTPSHYSFSHIFFHALPKAPAIRRYALVLQPKMPCV